MKKDLPLSYEEQLRRDCPALFDLQESWGFQTRQTPDPNDEEEYRQNMDDDDLYHSKGIPSFDKSKWGGYSSDTGRHVAPGVMGKSPDDNFRSSFSLTPQNSGARIGSMRSKVQDKFKVRKDLLQNINMKLSQAPMDVLSKVFDMLDQNSVV